MNKNHTLIRGFQLHTFHDNIQGLTRIFKNPGILLIALLDGYPPPLKLRPYMAL